MADRLTKEFDASVHLAWKAFLEHEHNPIRIIRTHKAVQALCKLQPHDHECQVLAIFWSLGRIPERVREDFQYLEETFRRYAKPSASFDLAMWFRRVGESLIAMSVWRVLWGLVILDPKATPSEKTEAEHGMWRYKVALKETRKGRK